MVCEEINLSISCLKEKSGQEILYKCNYANQNKPKLVSVGPKNRKKGGRNIKSVYPFCSVHKTHQRRAN